MPAHEDRSRGDDKELEDDGPVEVLDDDDIAVLKSYVCSTPHALTRYFRDNLNQSHHPLTMTMTITMTMTMTNSQAGRTRKRSATPRRR